MEHFSKAAAMLIAAALPLMAEAKQKASGSKTLPISQPVAQDTASLQMQPELTVSEAAAVPCFVDVPQIHDSQRATHLTNAALQELLLGDQTEAARLLELAITEEPNAVLARAALLATHQVSDAAAQQLHLQVIQRYMEENGVLTPAEELLIPWLLDLARGQHDAALKKIQAHTERFRNDTYARCWEILLLHYTSDGYDILGHAAPDQMKAEELARMLYETKPDDALVCYIRALVEEGRPTPGTEACEAAQAAARLLPNHALVQQLCAHLLCRAGEYEAALGYVKTASRCAETNANRQVEKRSDGAGEMAKEASERWILLKLYESSLLTMLHGENQALALRRELNAIPLATGDAGSKLEPHQILLRWEAHTLPLRVLFAPDAPLTTSRIKAACKAATLPPEACISSNEHHALNTTRDCLESSLLAILYARAKRTAKAEEYLKLAESYAERLHSLAPTAVSSSTPLLARYLTRQMEACAVGIALAKSQLHPEQAEIWQDTIRDATRAPSVLMPPVMPGLTQPQLREQPSPTKQSPLTP